MTLIQSLKKLGFKRIAGGNAGRASYFGLGGIYAEHHKGDDFVWLVGNTTFDHKGFPGGYFVWSCEDMKKYVDDFTQQTP